MPHAKRLKQPLCYQKEVRDNYYARLLVLSYDSIYNLLYLPDDSKLKPEVIRANAKIMLTNLYNFLADKVAKPSELFDESNNTEEQQ